jgi:TonB family protein
MFLAVACSAPVPIRTVALAFPKSVVPVSNGRDLPALVRVVVLPNGTVSDASISQTTGIPIFDDAAVSAVKQWQFQPSSSTCTPAPYGINVTFKQVQGLPKSYDACNHEVILINQAMPHYPDAAARLSIDEVKVTIDVTVDEHGNITNAKISHGSGVASLDQSALSTANSSVYAPKFVACKPVPGGHFNFWVDFNPNA